MNLKLHRLGQALYHPPQYISGEPYRPLGGKHLYDGASISKKMMSPE